MRLGFRFDVKRAVIVVACAVGSAPLAAAQNDGNRFSTELSGFNEVHFSGGPPATLRGAIFTQAKGAFRAHIDDRRDQIAYQLNYSGLEGNVTQAHIHFGQKHTVGGIVVWLCQTTGVPAPADVAAVTPMCPPSGTVTGTIGPSQV